MHRYCSSLQSGNQTARFSIKTTDSTEKAKLIICLPEFSYRGVQVLLAPSPIQTLTHKWKFQFEFETKCRLFLNSDRKRKQQIYPVAPVGPLDRFEPAAGRFQEENLEFLCLNSLNKKERSSFYNTNVKT